MKRGGVGFVVLVVLAAAVGVIGRAGTASSRPSRLAALRPTRIVRSTGNDVSAPLRDLQREDESASADDPDAEQVSDADQVGNRESHEGDGEEEDLHRPIPSRSATLKAAEQDAAVQPRVQATATTPPAPPAMQNFNGINNAKNPTGATTITPPDTNIAVGEHYILEAVNQSIAVYSKTGALRSGFPKKVSALWSGFNAGPSCRDLNDGDPVVFYDQLAKRFVVTQFALHRLHTNTGFNAECIAVSQTSDPSGAYYRYQFDYTTTDINDYPKFGVWPDAYYATYNNFTDSTGDYNGIGVVAYERAQMLNGDPAQFVQFNVGPSIDGHHDEFGALPATLDGTTQPAPGTPEPIVQQEDDSFLWAQDEVLIRRLTVDWTTPANSSLSAGVELPTLAFDSEVCADWDPNCIAQPHTTSGLDALSDRLMYRASYRDFGTRNSLLINWTVDRGNDNAGIRWTEVSDATTGSPSIRQQRTYSPSATNRWLGSIAQDRFANMALAFNASSTGVYPSIIYTGRRSSDPLSQMTLAERKLVAGTGSQTSIHHRWGDYSSLAIDPIDDCTFWYGGEYYAATTTAGWRTRIGSFRFGSCISKIAIADAAVTEGNSGTQALPFTVHLSAKSSQTVTVHYATADGTAKAPSDYTATSGTLTFKPGEDTKTINVAVKGDTVHEAATETFSITLSSATAASISDAHATGTITDND
jgi:hypothetical protein